VCGDGDGDSDSDGGGGSDGMGIAMMSFKRTVSNKSLFALGNPCK
jgi:hypothetical protein